MVQTTAKGYPYPEMSDSPHGPDQLQDLAARADELTDAARMTVTERDALAAPDLYDGRVVMIVDSGGVWQRIEVYHADDPADPDAGGTWKILVDRAFANATYAPITVRGARAYLGSAASIQSGTWEKVPIGTVNNDTDGLFDSANNHIVFDKAGWWRISGGVGFFSSSAGSNRIAALAENGTRKARQSESPDASAPKSLALTTDIRSVAGDTVELQAWQDIGSGLSLSTGEEHTWLSAVYMGEV